MAGHTSSTSLDAPNRNRRIPDGIHSGWIIVAAVAIGILIGRAIPDARFAFAADPTPDATATRAAELEELNDLRTKVAQPVVCTPAPTATPTNTPTPSPTPTQVPAVPAGQAIRDSNGLVITVLSIQPITKPDGVEATGTLLQVKLTIENTQDTQQRPPFEQWRLVDQAGNRYLFNMAATAVIAGPTWAFSVEAHKVEDKTIVFDVAPDAGTTFILENEEDPTFRIEVSIESRG